ncbi:hypothetical protein SOASR030_29980 [Leminorella grimontii]|uniref:DUF4272 domain-containing protein n=1 Tax=Leminorella grimontii TaxID=82981 RepID=A0AAV5N467_9GAMM|nr:DUF4272 domain-containing protein [Leminorella grimontii]KFC94921.1 hypothetical protein GLGR_2352 [Leminorella grimontii ATCC 33999 = DSM 5078]GKX56886.1 hypothetical protein SOASR030_29980 [Leminorella grimontii]VFS61085.1 Uncharacterised protein [Leminorella grimontii]
MALLLNVYSTLHTPSAPAFPHRLNHRRDRSDPELKPHLNGFQGYVYEKSGSQMTAHLYHLLQHIGRVQTQFSLEIEEENTDAFFDWMRQVNGICFCNDGSVISPEGELLATPGEGDITGSVPYPADALARKASNDAYCQKLGVRVANSLPPVMGEGEAVLRSAKEVAERCVALLSVAARALSLSQDEGDNIENIYSRLPLAASLLSPEEACFMAEPSPQEQDVINAVWRYEALALLLWSLGKIDKLSLPTEICDVDGVTDLILAEDTQSFIDAARLRPADEILDALDLCYRLHWAIREAGQRGEDIPANLSGSVISERHHALNWLVRFEDAEWDEVDTPA